MYNDILNSEATIVSYVDYVAVMVGEGPRYTSRLLITRVESSILLNTVPVCATAKMSTIYRKTALRMLCAFVIISDEVVYVGAEMLTTK